MASKFYKTKIGSVDKKTKLILPDKKAFMTLVILILIIIGVFQALFFYVSSLVQPDYYQKQVVSEIRERTGGQDVQVSGGVRFSLLPHPKVIVSGMTLGGETSIGSASPKLEVEKVEIAMSFLSIFSEKIKLSNISLVNPSLTIVRGNDNVINWGWLDAKLLRSLNTNSDSNVVLPIYVQGGKIQYLDIANKKSFVAYDIDAKNTSSYKIALSGTMKSGDHVFDFNLNSDEADIKISDTEFPLNFQLNEGDGHVLNVQSVINSTSDNPRIHGNFSLKSKDINYVLDLLSETPRKSVQEIKDLAQVPSLPLDVVGTWKLDNDAVKITDVDINGLNSKGMGTGSIKWSSWYPTIAADLEFEYVDYLAWKKLIDERLAASVRKQQYKDFEEVEETTDYDFGIKNPLPEGIEVQININAKSVKFNKEEWRDTYLSATLDKGTFTVNQCNIKLDGNGILSIFGIISQGGTGDLRFEGNMEAHGDSLNKAINMFYSAGSDLPITLDKFSVNANLYIQAGQVRLFETEGSINGIPLEGAFTIYPEQYRVETTLKMDNVNFDGIREKLMERKRELSKNSDKINDKPLVSFDWLKKLGVRFDARVKVNNFTFMENQGEKAELSLYINAGDLRISNFILTYPYGTDEYNVNLDVRRELPVVNVMVSANQINTDYFTLDPKSTKKQTTVEEIKDDVISKSFMETPLPLDWMDSVNGMFDITLRKLVHNGITVEKIKLQAKLENKQLNIQRSSFLFSQAESTLYGQIYGGKVPGIKLSFTMTNADVYEIIKPVLGLTNISGFANISGSFSSDGLNFSEWLQNLEAQIIFLGRGIKVQKFNLAGISDVVDVARSSADVFANVNNVLTKGITEFAVDGSMNIKKGLLNIPGLAVKSGFISGGIMGKLKLDTLDGQFQSTFQFPNISAEVVPILIIQLAGNMSKPDMKVDTSSLEDYVARKRVMH